MILMVAQCVVANTPDPEPAQQLASFLLSTEAQEAALKDRGDGGLGRHQREAPGMEPALQQGD
ncbi:hypothetical protein [Azospirillum sp. sgz301742]